MTKRPKCVRRSKNGRSGTQTAQPEVFNETGNQKKEEKLLFNHSFFSALLDEAIRLAKSIPGGPYPSIAVNSKVEALAGLGRNSEALALAQEALAHAARQQSKGRSSTKRSRPAPTYTNSLAAGGTRSPMTYELPNMRVT